MLVRDIRRIVFFVGPALLLFYVAVNLYTHSADLVVPVNRWRESGAAAKPQAGGKDGSSHDASPLNPGQGHKVDGPAAAASPSSPPGSDGSADAPPAASPSGLDGSASSPTVLPPAHNLDVPAASPPTADAPTDNSKSLAETILPNHQMIFSTSTFDKKFFPIDFGGKEGANPNIIPHPTLENTWIVVAQLVRSVAESSKRFEQIVCNAVFKDGGLRCLQPATTLPIALTTGRNCDGEFDFFDFNDGPHDARVFYGPDKPYTVYGSNSDLTCFGQWAQDFRKLVPDWGTDLTGSPEFHEGTELHRPAPYGAVEKNWFLFWDNTGQMYAHYDVTPKRVFAQVNQNGSVGADLAPAAAEADAKCFAKYLPKLPPKLESIHQATNSLKITMCKRADALCIANDDNTFILTIFQHKSFYSFHSVYEPYVMLFKQRAPFEAHAISRKPTWINGREIHMERNTTDMFYVTSVTWKGRDRKYHGYLDDELFVGFGIEDKRSGGIDLLAGDLLANLGTCLES